MSTRYGLVMLLALGLAFPVLAQESAAVLAAKQHLRALSTDAALTGSDLADLRALDSYPDRRTGATMVYLAQQHAGIDVFGAVAPVAVLPSGKTHGLAPRNFAVGLASRVNATEPRLAAASARVAAEAHVRALMPAPDVSRLGTRTDDPAADAAVAAPVAYDATEPRLVYEPTQSGAIRLAWYTTLTGGGQLWSVRVDALTGAVLAADDLVDYDQWPVTGPAPAAVSFAPLASPAKETSVAPRQGGASYRVLAWPVESPIHGSFSVVADPADATASPSGWHDTGVQTYTTTRGNNVWALPNRDHSNDGATPVPDAEGVPDGGASLTFNDVYDETQNPGESTEAVVTNLFYWGNIFHDVTYQYGFDEAAGNFQTNNFGNPGFGNDAAFLEAQSGAKNCTLPAPTCQDNFAAYNNANFLTPGDGSPGRMRMFEWYGGGSFTITAPTTIAGSSTFGRGLFGVPGQMTGEIVPAVLGNGQPSEGCTQVDFGNAAAIAGKLVLISRGTCPFTQKVRSAEAIGATGVVIHNIPQTDPNAPAVINMAINSAEDDDIGIPSLFISEFVGNRIRNQTATVTIDATLPPRRDSDLDAGIIAHEFGHGLSNRLTGGPSSAGCLNTGTFPEQMGEGWSDYYGLLLTMTEASDTPRGIATYVNFEETGGIGIRNAPYTRDFAVNDFTYQDVITSASATPSGPRGLSIPHGVGFAWATMLWDMTLDLTDAHGFDPNVYDADGGAGNQIALNLVTQGMKLQPCGPGFVDGRDAILEADTLLYGGANSDIIWAAFARRGLGLNADQGNSNNPNDGTADFTVPVANERGPNTDGARLAIDGPNPVRGTTTIALSLEAPEDVSVHVLDLLGREVQTLHAGTLAAGTRHGFELNAASLSPGVYVVRASGETFSATRRVTIVR